MAKYLITGVAGTGKSSVAHELRKRGYAAYDTDAGFSYYADKKTGEKVTRPHHPTLEWYSAHERIFDEKILKNLFKKHTDEPLFIASITANQNRFYPDFDRIFLLTANDQTLAHRLKTRTSSHFGKQPIDLHRVLSGRANFDQELLNVGAIEVSSEQPIEKVVGQILSSINDH